MDPPFGFSKLRGHCKECGKADWLRSSGACDDCEVAFKSRLIDEWQARNRRLFTEKTESRRLWRSLWVVTMRLLFRPWFHGVGL